MIILLYNAIRILPRPSNICKEIVCYPVAISSEQALLGKRDYKGESRRTNDVWSEMSFSH